MAGLTPISGLTLDQLSEALEAAGIDRDYAGRVAYWIYRKRVSSLASMINIAGSVRKKIGECFVTGLTLPQQREESADGSVKYLFGYDGDRTVETVFIPEQKRNTVCVSTQCGCARACSYCRTGELGLTGNLSAGEIVNQIIAISEASVVSHVVFMGMGEPLDNVTEVIRAIEILTAGWGLAIAASHITVSTVGIIPGMEQLLSSTRCNLTFSLVSPISSERMSLVPAERIYPADRVIEVINSARPEKKRRFTIAYMMLRDVNDTDRHLDALIKLVAGTSLRINLLRYHQFGNMSYQPSEAGRTEYFRQKLSEAGIPVSIRKSRGEDISAACGMLGETINKNK